MPIFKIRYTETVTYEAVIDSIDRDTAIHSVKNGEVTDIYEIDSYLEKIVSVQKIEGDNYEEN